MDVTVVVPTYNRRPVLQRTVHCLLQQDAQGVEYEIVVVDDQSTDDTWEWLGSQVSEYPRLRAARSRSKGRASARNTGIDEARGALICFVDDDVWVAPGFVAAHWQVHQTCGPDRVAIGRLGVCDETAPGIANEYEDARLMRVEQRIEASGDQLVAGFFRTGNVSVSRDLLRRVGGFDEAFTGYSYEDSELGYRLLAGGAVFVYAPAAGGVHHTDVTVEQVLRKSREAGRSAVTFLRRWPEAVEHVPAPFPVPGVPTPADSDGACERFAKMAALSEPSQLVFRALLGLAIRTGSRSLSFRLLEWARWGAYSRSFRQASQGKAV